MKSEFQVGVCVSKVATCVDEQSKLTDIIVNIIVRWILFIIIPIICIRLGFVRNMCIVDFFNKFGSYATLKNMVFPNVTIYISRY